MPRIGQSERRISIAHWRRENLRKRAPFFFVLLCPENRPIASMLIRITLAFYLSLMVACAPIPQQQCSGNESLLVHESLYFGTSKPNGIVSAADWSTFLSRTVTPRFPQGFTVLPASGQWRGADGSIVLEATYVLHLVHPDDTSNEKAVEEIISIYRKQFEQESVLRAKVPACVSF